VAQVRLLLSGYHDLPDRAQFDRVADAPAIVKALAHGPDGPTRDRALAALGRYWPSGDVYLLYARVLAADSTPVGTRHRVMVYFADAFGERAIPAIRPYLSNQDPQLRISAVHALGRIGSDQAIAVLDRFADDETNAVVLEAVDDASRTLR
jgi:HEAT repeat protein